MLYFALLLLTCTAALLRARTRRKTRREQSLIKEKIIDEVDHLLTLGNWSRAKQILELLNRYQKEHPQLKVLQMRTARLTGDLESALTLAQSCTPADPNWLAILREEGKVLLRLGKPQEALKKFEECRAILRSAEDHHAIASAHYALGAYEQALAILTPELRHSASADQLALAADCRFAQENYAEALSLYKQAQKGGIKTEKIIERMGYCFRNLHQPQETEHCFRRLFKSNPNNVNAALNLGICLEQQSRYLDALTIYQTESIWSRCDPRVMRRAGVAAVHTGRYRFAETYLKAAHSFDAMTADSLAYLGYAVERLRRWHEAEAVYHQLTQKYPNCAAGFRGLAWLYGVGLSCQIEAEQGVTMAHRLIELAPDAESWELLSACEARTGNFDQAHEIHESLTDSLTQSLGEQDLVTLQRRRKAMRSLRRQLPLDETLVSRGLVA